MTDGIEGPSGNGAGGRVRVACDVGGTFTGHLRPRGGDRHAPRRESAVYRGPNRGRTRRRERGRNRPEERGPVLARDHAGDERAHHPELPTGHHGDHHGIPRCDRNPERHARRSLGYVQGARAAVHPAARPPRRHRARRLFRQDPHAARRGRGTRCCGRDQAAGRDKHRRLLRERLRQPGERTSNEGDTRGGDPGGDRFHIQRRAAGDLRARAVLDDGGEHRDRPGRRQVCSRPRDPAARRRLHGRSAAPALGRRRDDAEDM